MEKPSNTVIVSGLATEYASFLIFLICLVIMKDVIFAQLSEK